jgi:hypothetical protein
MVLITKYYIKLLFNRFKKDKILKLTALGGGGGNEKIETFIYHGL